MSKSIPDSAIHVGMSTDELAARICSDDPASQAPLLSAIRLASGWTAEQITAAEDAYAHRGGDPSRWRAVKRDYLETFLDFADRWRQCG
jgi:hypothetical protein